MRVLSIEFWVAGAIILSGIIATANFARPWIALKLASWRVRSDIKKQKAIAIAFLPEQFEELKKQQRELVEELKLNGEGKSRRELVKNVELRITMLERRQLILYGNKQFGVFQTDAEGRLEWANPAMEQLSKRSEAKLLGYGWFSFIAEHERTEIRTSFLAALKDGEEFSTDFKAKDSKQPLLVVTLHSYPLEDKDGVPVKYLHFATPCVEDV